MYASPAEMSLRTLAGFVAAYSQSSESTSQMMPRRPMRLVTAASRVNHGTANSCEQSRLGCKCQRTHSHGHNHQHRHGHSHPGTLDAHAANRFAQHVLFTAALVSPYGGRYSVGRRHRPELTNACVVLANSVYTCADVRVIKLGWVYVCDSCVNCAWKASLAMHGSASRLPPMRKNDTGMPGYPVNMRSRPGVKMLGPSSNVSAYTPLSIQSSKSAVGWHGPQSAGQFPHVCQYSDPARKRCHQQHTT